MKLFPTIIGNKDSSFSAIPSIFFSTSLGLANEMLVCDIWSVLCCTGLGADAFLHNVKRSKIDPQEYNTKKIKDKLQSYY